MVIPLSQQPRLRTFANTGFIDRYPFRGSSFVRSWISRNSVIHDAVPGPCQCSHVRPAICDYSIVYYPTGYPSGSQAYAMSWVKCPIVPNNIPALREILKQKAYSLDWEKLPSSSSFGLIQIIAEIDDLIAMFTLRFIRELSYGSFTWGVVPFVSDLKALCDAVSNLLSGLDEFHYEDSFELGIELPPYNHYMVGGAPNSITSQAIIRTTTVGDADLTTQNPAQRALDWLGFHPDLATAWDLIPFSFVVDYLFPIGDFLESLRNGGWVQALSVTGWRTYKISVNLLDNVYYGPRTGERHRISLSPYKEFTRVYGPMVLVRPEEVPRYPGLKLPSPIQMFNMLYLSMQQGRRTPKR